MRIVVFFDLPVKTKAELRSYRKFRTFLIKEGFLQMQESVYSKICLNTTGVDTVIRKLDARKPEKGLVQVLVITEKQFARIRTIVGTPATGLLNDNERISIL